MRRRDLLAGLVAGAAWPGLAAAAEAEVETAVARVTGPDGRNFGVRFRWARGLAGQAPLVVFSHGFGGDLSAFPLTSAAWAAAGYVTAHPTHSDSLRPAPDRTALGAELAELRALRTSGQLVGEKRDRFVKMLDDPAHLDGRASDVKGVLAAAAGGPGLPEALKGRIDMSRLGMAGHSYGAYTTLALGGAQVMRDGALKSFAESRFAAFMVISGQGTGRMGLDDASFAPMGKPTLWITGSKDIGAADETPQWRLEPFAKSPAGDKYSLFVDGARHGDFDEPPGPRELAAELRAREVAFWNAYLRRDAAARRVLAGKPQSPGLTAGMRL